VVDMVGGDHGDQGPDPARRRVLGFAAPTGNTGLWPAALEARLDVMMLASCLLLLAIGPGKASFDQRN